jgi:predicted amidophosphoribosyltransferase
MAGGAGGTPKCPVCQASFRGAEICPRCGADLRVLMLLAAEAYSLRREAKRYLLAGDAEAALATAAEAQKVHATVPGEILTVVC